MKRIPWIKVVYIGALREEINKVEAYQRVVCESCMQQSKPGAGPMPLIGIKANRQSDDG